MKRSDGSSPSTTGATTRRTHRPSRTPSTTRCAGATRRSRRGFRTCKSSESLTEKVGAKASEKFAKVRHRVPMLSLANGFADEDVEEFVERIRRFLQLKPEAPLAFTAEPKIDGLSLSLRYEDGRLVTAATRGDGAEGEDVTPNARTVADIPEKLKGANVPEVCEIRGEIYLSHADFAAINERQAAAASRSSPTRAMPPPAACASSIRRSPHRGRCTSSPMPGAR